MKKIIVISGGTDGLGKTIAQTLAPKHTVVILSSHKEKLQKTASELQCDYEVCDVSDYGQVETAIRHILERHTKIDCVINNAGVWIEGELDTNDPQDIQKAIDVNTLGTIYLSKAVIPSMKKQSNGLIINIISQAGLYAKGERTVYNASKWALTGFTKSLQPELATYGIGVTGLYPGKMKTQMFEKMGIHKDMKDGLDTQQVAKTIEFLLSFDNQTVFPEIGIKHRDN